MKIFVDYHIIETEEEVDFGIVKMEIVSDDILSDKQARDYKDLVLKYMEDDFEGIREKAHGSGIHRLSLNIKHHYSFDGITPMKKWINHYGH